MFKAWTKEELCCIVTLKCGTKSIRAATIQVPVLSKESKRLSGADPGFVVSGGRE
jgi:hypothetical protein